MSLHDELILLEAFVWGLKVDYPDDSKIIDPIIEATEEAIEATKPTPPSGPNLIVPVGATYTVDGIEVYDTVEVHGVLQFDRQNRVELQCGDLIVHAGGHLNLGTEEVPHFNKVIITIRGLPFAADDTEEVGRGIRCHGLFTAYGRFTDKEWEVPRASIGAKRLSGQVPATWRVGDILYIPDLRPVDSAMQDGNYEWFPNYQVWSDNQVSPPNKRYYINNIDDDGVELDRPLEHPLVMVGTELPAVYNLSRNITIGSETLTRKGHIMMMGNSISKLVNIRLKNLGRTTRALGSQIGRYAFHTHHCTNVHKLAGCSITGDNTTKWGIAFHDTDEWSVVNTIICGFDGAGLACEEGVEVGDIHDCVACDITGEGNPEGIGNDERAAGGAQPQLRGTEGAGFWLSNYVEIMDCDAVNCKFGFVNIGVHYGISFGRYYHSESNPGMIHDREYSEANTSLIYRDCAALACVVGMEVWAGSNTNAPVEKHPKVRGAHIGHCHNGVVVGRFSSLSFDGMIFNDPALLTGRDDTIYQHDWFWHRGIIASSAYSDFITLIDTQIIGMDIALTESKRWELSRVQLQDCRFGFRTEQISDSPRGDQFGATVKLVQPVNVTFLNVGQAFEWKHTHMTEDWPDNHEWTPWLEWDPVAEEHPYLKWDEAKKSNVKVTQ